MHSPEAHPPSYYCATRNDNTEYPALCGEQRSDVCVVPAAGVIGEAMVAIVLAQAFLEKFGGDSLGETKRNYEGYLEQVRQY